MASPEIDQLARILAKLPGLGARSSQRAVLALLKRRETLGEPLLRALREAFDKVVACSICGNLDSSDPCTICASERRDRSVILVCEEVQDLWAMERARTFAGLYHVLGGKLSAIDAIGPEELGIDRLVARLSEGVAQEAILALGATVDGQTTAHYIAERLSGLPIKVSRLGHGVPVGGELNYLDEGTLQAALRSRQPVG